MVVAGGVISGLTTTLDPVAGSLLVEGTLISSVLGGRLDEVASSGRTITPELALPDGTG